MKIKWYGQAAFAITASAGRRIICDPYTPEELGFAPIADKADIVITSSDDDSAHCRHDLVPGDHLWLNALDAARAGGHAGIGGLDVMAMEVDAATTSDAGGFDANAMYRFTVDGIDIAHMGDCGTTLDGRQTDFLKGADILLALTGADGLVLPLGEVMRVIDETCPKIVIPMHFRTLCYKPRSLEWIGAFLAFWDEERDVDFAFGCEVELTRGDLPGKTRVLVMDYAR